MVSFGTTNYIGIYVVPPRLSEFKRHNPDIAVSFTVDFLPNIAELLEYDKIDFAFLPESKSVLSNSQYICRRFCDDEMALVFPKNHDLAKSNKISPQQLEEYPFATREFVLDRLKEAGIILRNTINLYNTEAIKQGIINGMGVSILSRFSVMNEIAGHLLEARPIDGVNLTRALYLVHKKIRPLTAESRSFINSICDALNSSFRI